MDFRKLIKFGGNSYVISLPISWVNDNRLKKGDLLSVENEGGILRVSPHDIKKEIKENIAEITIDFDKLKTFKHLKTHLTAAYINGYDQITIIGRDMLKELPKIRGLAQNFIALEIIEQTDQRIVLREFVNIQEVSLQETVRRIDRIIISMAEDTEKHLLGQNDLLDLLKQKDEDIFKLHNFVFRAIKCMMRHNQLNQYNINQQDIIYYWELVIFMEKIADQIKRIPRYTKGKVHQKVIDTYKEIVQYYKDTMKANYTKDSQAAIELINKRKQIFNECEADLKYLPRSAFLATEKMKNATNHITYLSKTLIKYKY